MSLFDLSIESVIESIPDDVKNQLLDKLIMNNPEYVLSKIGMESLIDHISQLSITLIADMLKRIDNYKKVKLSIPNHQLIDKYGLHDRDDIFIYPRGLDEYNNPSCRSMLITNDNKLINAIKADTDCVSYSGTAWYKQKYKYMTIKEYYNRYQRQITKNMN
jgi:hypothetical protein